MTREEAIHYGKDYLKDLTTACCHIEDKHKDFVRMAIKALEQEPCEDAISRQAVLEQIDQWAIGNREYLPTNAMHYLTKRIQDIPPVNPTKTGHWILQPSNKEQGEKDFIWWKCSECGQVIYSETEKDKREFHAFCGRCGARMDKPQERSDKE